MSDMLFNNPGNQPYRHVPFLINPGDNEADFILFPRSTVIIAAVGDGIDADGEANKNGSLMDIGDGPGIFSLYLAFPQVCFAGVAIDAFDIGLHRDVVYVLALDI